jgi:hypothetical protein
VSVQTVDIANALPRLVFEIDTEDMKMYQDAEDFELGMALRMSEFFSEEIRFNNHTIFQLNFKINVRART